MKRDYPYVKLCHNKGKTMGKNVLIVGASGGIGSEIAKLLGNAGYQLILHFNENKDSIERITEEVPNESILLKVKANLQNTAQLQSFFNQLVFPIDHIIFAQGKAYYGLFQDTSEQVMDTLLNLHVKAPWLICKELLPSMIKQQKGNIIFISSIWGEVGASNEVIYSSVKGAQNSFVKALAKEVGPSSISVNGISPGFIQTKMNEHLSAEDVESIVSEIPLQRIGMASEVAHAVQFLLDEHSNYIQGQIIKIDGGWQ